MLEHHVTCRHMTHTLLHGFMTLFVTSFVIVSLTSAVDCTCLVWANNQL